jgi:hypothetical protein
MSSSANPVDARSPKAGTPEPDLLRTYLLVLAVEAAVILLLYWLGRAFA